VSRIAKVAAAALAAGALTTAAAVGLPPPKSGKFVGTTSQRKATHHRVVLNTTPDSGVSHFRIGWRVKCKRPKTFANGVTEYGPGGAMPQNGDTFYTSAPYSGDLEYRGGSYWPARSSSKRRYPGEYLVSVKGHFTDRNHAHGRFRVSVTIENGKGQPGDSCSGSVAWKVHRKTR
jgi:hypothetical protein